MSYRLSDEQIRQARDARNVAKANGYAHTTLGAVPQMDGYLILPGGGTTWDPTGEVRPMTIRCMARGHQYDADLHTCCPICEEPDIRPIQVDRGDDLAPRGVLQSVKDGVPVVLLAALMFAGGCVVAGIANALANLVSEWTR